VTDPGIVASYSRALARAGITVTFQRWAGAAPNRQLVASATVTAVVRDYQPDGSAEARGGSSASKMGAITEGDRIVIVLAGDLAAQHFPLPVLKNDRIQLPSYASGIEGDYLNITEVDPFKRAVGGAIELKASGVQ
jgi:hypothetical protein